ncbi:MAG TPA: thiamine-phosphate kinase [Terracidiphilus sp.]|nr:thiamine-phosphate kinase [Terracidiphilus sp.]
MSSTREPGELGLIAKIRQRQGNKPFPGLAKGIGDDCAVLQSKPGEQIVVTTDLSIEGRHFLLEWHSPEAVGHRTLARGLSDLAAMGAHPVAAFLSLGLPPELTRRSRRQPSWMDGFLDGFFALARTHKTPLAGGDLAQTETAVADIVLVGAVPRGRALLRSGAHAGDRLYVTGVLGGSSVGLKKLEELAAKRRYGPVRLSPKMQEALAAHVAPQPRLAQGLWLQRRRIATAAIDLSDGLSTDLAHLCEESGVAAEVYAEDLPIATGATLAQALHGGEDYELLFAAPAQSRVPRTIAGLAISCIGQMVPRRRGRAEVVLRSRGEGQPLAPQGWQHFRSI